MIRFGVLGAARIAPKAIIQPCADEDGADVHCVAARDRGRAEGFAAEHGIPVVHEEYADVISDPAINAVYNPLPISLHHEWISVPLTLISWMRSSVRSKRASHCLPGRLTQSSRCN